MKLRETIDHNKQKIMAGVTVMVASLALAACGKNTSTTETGSSAIGDCPPHYVEKGQKPVGSRDQFKAELGGAVVRLSAILPRNGLGDALTKLNGASREQELAIAAAQDVFYVEAYDGTDIDHFETDTPQTRLNDLSEEFCIQDGKTYVAPNTANAIGAMQAAGIQLGPELIADSR